MKRFDQFLIESKKKNSHKKNKKGHVVLLHALGDYSGMKRHGKKRGIKEETQPMQDWRNSHYSDADENIGDIGKFTGSKGLNEYEFNEATTLSSKLEKAQGEVSEDHKKSLKAYTGGSSNLNNELIKAHHEGREPFSEWPESIRKQALRQHNAIMQNTHGPGQAVSLFTGTPHDFGAMGKEAKDGIVHSPAHISASHDIGVGMHFARQAAGWNGEAQPGAQEDDAHMVHIRVKPHNKIVHMSHHSDYPAEHESVVPAGTKLKYSHSTTHWTKREADGGPGSERRRVQIHHYDIHDPWIKD
jgi:hypothetical protein